MTKIRPAAYEPGSELLIKHSMPAVAPNGRASLCILFLRWAAPRACCEEHRLVVLTSPVYRLFVYFHIF